MKHCEPRWMPAVPGLLVLSRQGLPSTVPEEISPAGECGPAGTTVTSWCLEWFRTGWAACWCSRAGMATPAAITTRPAAAAARRRRTRIARPCRTAQSTGAGRGVIAWNV